MPRVFAASLSGMWDTLDTEDMSTNTGSCFPLFRVYTATHDLSELLAVLSDASKKVVEDVLLSADKGCRATSVSANRESSLTV